MNDSKFNPDGTRVPAVVETEPKQLLCQIPASRRELVQDGSAKDGTYILPITAQLEGLFNLPPTVSIEGEEFARKKEFHVTLLGFGTRQLLKKRIDEEAEAGQNLVQEINAILSGMDFSFSPSSAGATLIQNLDYDQEAVISQTGRAAFESESTIVLGIDMPGLAEFYERMRGLGLELGRPAAHVTLYLKQNGVATGLGIAITDFQAQLAGTAFPQITAQKIELP
jgi:hypothetical protein